MKSYRYAKLDFGGSSVSLLSTDSQMLDWTLTELKKAITNLRVSTDELPSGEAYIIYIDKLQDKGVQAGWWILKQLCLKGWEPFAAHIDRAPPWRFLLSPPA